MKQSTVIFGTLLLAFIVYITVRGQLPAYLDLFNSTKKTPVSENKNVKDDSASFVDKIEKMLSGYYNQQLKERGY